MKLDADNDGSRIGRRTALKGAAVSAAAIWTTPVVLLLSTETASAASSPPPRVDTPGDHQVPPAPDHQIPPAADHPGHDVPAGSTVAESPTQSEESAAGSLTLRSAAAPAAVDSVPDGTSLAYTGVESVGLFTAAGAGAVAMGGAALAAANVMKRRAQADGADPDVS